MVSQSTNINKANRYLLSHIFERKKDHDLCKS